MQSWKNPPRMCGFFFVYAVAKLWHKSFDEILNWLMLEMAVRLNEAHNHHLYLYAICKRYISMFSPFGTSNIKWFAMELAWCSVYKYTVKWTWSFIAVPINRLKTIATNENGESAKWSGKRSEKWKAKKINNILAQAQMHTS